MLSLAERERRRRAIEAIVARERTQQQVADEFGVSRQAVANWVRKYRDSGNVAGGYERKHGRMLTRDQSHEIQEIVAQQVPSDFDIESEDDRWHWLELQDLIFLKFQKRVERKLCRQWLIDWGIPDPEISRSRKRELKNRAEPMAPMSASETEELQQLLKAYQDRKSKDEARAATAARERTLLDREKTRLERKKKDQRRKSNKRAQKQKQKLRRRKR